MVYSPLGADCGCHSNLARCAAARSSLLTAAISIWMITNFTQPDIVPTCRCHPPTRKKLITMAVDISRSNISGITYTASLIQANKSPVKRAATDVSGLIRTVGVFLCYHYIHTPRYRSVVLNSCWRVYAHKTRYCEVTVIRKHPSDSVYKLSMVWRDERRLFKPEMKPQKRFFVQRIDRYIWKTVV